MGSDHRFLSQTSEWYTPPHVIEAAREFFGGVIHLDPASSAKANEVVGARDYRSHDGKGSGWEPWLVAAERVAVPGERVNIWLNPPYGRNVTGAWVRKAIETTEASARVRLLLLVNAVPGVSWFVPLLRYPICWLHERLAFISPDGKVQGSPTHGNALVLLEQRMPFPVYPYWFAQVFERTHKLGTVTIPLHDGYS